MRRKTIQRLPNLPRFGDAATRARTLFEYLQDWVPPEGGTDTVPPRAELFPVTVEQERLEVAASCPTAAEQEEALKRSMHRALKEIVDRLADAAGNQFPVLCEAARRLSQQLDGPFETLDMPDIYLTLGTLRSARERGQEEG